MNQDEDSTKVLLHKDLQSIFGMLRADAAARERVAEKRNLWIRWGLALGAVAVLVVGAAMFSFLVQMGDDMSTISSQMVSMRQTMQQMNTQVGSMAGDMRSMNAAMTPMSHDMRLMRHGVGVMAHDMNGMSQPFRVMNNFIP
jgi:HAMP domain-containing protein